MLAAATNNPGHTESPPQPGGSLRSKEALGEGGSNVVVFIAVGEKMEQGPTWGKGLNYHGGLARSAVWVVEAGQRNRRTKSPGLVSRLFDDCPHLCACP